MYGLSSHLHRQKESAADIFSLPMANLNKSNETVECCNAEEFAADFCVCKQMVKSERASIVPQCRYDLVEFPSYFKDSDDIMLALFGFFL